jgi:hypothetical protein
VILGLDLVIVGLDLTKPFFNLLMFNAYKLYKTQAELPLLLL